MKEYIFKEETFNILGRCFDVHNHFGKGFLKVIYKDALEYEFNKNNIFFEREKEYVVNYKNVILPHKFYADFVVYDKIVLEVKSVKALSDAHIAQSINYLKVSGNRIALLVNFGQPRLEYQRLIV